MQIIASYIYTTDCHMQFNCTHFCLHMIFLLMLKNFIGKNFLSWLFLTFFKKSIISLTLLDLNKFLDFPWLSWPSGNPALVGRNSKSQKPRPAEVPRVFYEHPWNFHFFVNWPLEFPLALSLISLENLCPQPSLSPVWIFFGITHSPSPWVNDQSWAFLI